MHLLMESRQGRSKQRLTSDGVRQVTGCVVINTQTREVLLVSSRKNEGVWILPKGGWENDETEEAAAVRETWEEAGVVGDVAGFLGRFDHHKKDKDGLPRAYFSFYELHVTRMEDEWPERRQRVRQWFKYEDAFRNAEKPFMREALGRCSLAKNKASETTKKNTPSMTRKSSPSGVKNTCSVQ